MKFTTPLIGTTLAFTLLGGAAFAGEDMADWDMNADHEVTQDEWVSAFQDQGYFDLIDENGNSVLEVDEVDQALISDYDVHWDIDDDGLVEEEESIIALFNVFDENGDKVMDDQEFRDFDERLSNTDLTRSSLES